MAALDKRRSQRLIREAHRQRVVAAAGQQRAAVALLVGALEELVFRAYACTVIGRYTANPAAIVAISAAAFGLIHWSLGLNTVLITAAIGAVFMVIYLRTRSAPALMLAHFAVNFIDFAGVIPKAIFKVF